MTNSTLHTASWVYIAGQLTRYGEVISPGIPQANAGTAIDLCYCWQEESFHETEDRILHPLPGQNVRIAHGIVVATLLCRIPE